MKIGYIRISKRDQIVDRQIDGLESHCDETTIEKISATAAKRPLFDETIERLQEGDTFVIWDLDRAFRSTIEALLIAEKLRDRGVNFQIINQGVDTGTDIGRVVYGVLALFAEFELSNIRRRTKEGLQAAKKRGKTLGRPSKLDKKQIALARQEIDAGRETITSMATNFSVDRKTLSRALSA